MENVEGENFDELGNNRQIRQYFPPPKFCAIRYVQKGERESVKAGAKPLNAIAREVNHYTHARLSKNEIAPEFKSKVRQKKLALTGHQTI